MLTGEIIIRSMGTLVGVLASFMLVGELLLRFFKRGAFSNLFERFYWSGLVGLVLVVSVYAIYVASLRTILLLCPVLVILFVQALPYSKNRKTVGYQGTPFIFAGAALGLYFVFYLTAFINISTPGMIKFVAVDNLYYARLAAYLNFTGREITNPEYLFPEAYSTMPYHYGDLWLCALTSQVSGLKPPFALLLVTYPCLSVLTVLGIAGIITHRFSFHRRWIFIAVPALLFSGITILYSVWIGDGYGPRPVANYPKTLWIAAFLAGTFGLIAKKQWNALLVLAAISAVTFINTLPALMGAVILLSFIQVFIFRQPVKTVLGTLAVAILTLLYLFCFYRFTAITQYSSLSVSGGGQTLLASLKDPVGAIKEVVLPIRQLVWYLPFVLLFVWACYWRKISINKIWFCLNMPECIWFLLLLLSGIIAWVLTRYYTIEAPQFYYNILLPLISIGVAVWAYWILNMKGAVLLKLAVVGILLALIVRNNEFNYDVAYRKPADWEALTSFLEGESAPVFVNIRSENEFPGVLGKSTRLFQPLPEINYIFNPYINESLDIPALLQDSLNVNTPAILMQLQNSSFYHYLQRPRPQKAANELQLDFAKSINASYLVVSKETSIPAVFRSIVVDSLFLTDHVLYKIRMN